MSLLRMKLLLHYALCVCVSYAAPAHARMLADSFGAIIGSLQGTDPNSPEVAVVMASINILCDRLMELGNVKASTKARLETIEMGFSILIISLELVPSTCVDALWKLIEGLVTRLPTKHYARMGACLRASWQKCKMRVDVVFWCKTYNAD